MATPPWRPGCSADVKWPHRFFTTGARAAGGGDESHSRWTLLTMLLPAPDEALGLAPEEHEEQQSLPLLLLLLSTNSSPGVRSCSPCALNRISPGDVRTMASMTIGKRARGGFIYNRTRPNQGEFCHPPSHDPLGRS